MSRQPAPAREPQRPGRGPAGEGAGARWAAVGAVLAVVCCATPAVLAALSVGTLGTTLAATVRAWAVAAVPATVGLVIAIVLVRARRR